MAGTTTRLQLPYPVPADAVDVPRDVKALADTLDPIAASFLVGLAGARPAAGVAGRFYLATDTGTLSADTGSTWLVVRGNDPIPIGTVSAFAGSVAPTNWLLCDGAAVSRATYAALFAVCGSAFGAGDGSTTFNLPDLRGRTVIGAGTGTGLSARALGAKGGEERHTLLKGEAATQAHGHADSFAVANAAAINTAGMSANASHAHSVGGGSLIYNANGGTGTAFATGGPISMYRTSMAADAANTDHVHTLPAHGHTLNGAVTNHAGSDATAAHENMPPFLAVGAIVKAL